MLSKMKSVNERVVYPNIYGSVSGYEVGTIFARRRDFKRIHTSKDAIACGPEGPFSILMLKNKNFLDDGHRIMLTSGEMEPRNYEDIEGPLNKTLMIGLRSKLPIRVIRSSFIGSIYAPKSGYRYDGLYQLEECQTILVDENHVVFKFLLVRLQRQLAVPWEDETSANATRFSADDETLEITGEPNEMDSEEINDSHVHLNGFQVEDTIYSLLESSHVKVEDSEVESVTVKREAAEPLKRESMIPQDGKASPYCDAQMCQSKVYRGLRFIVDQLSLSVSDDEELSTAVKMAAKMYDGAIIKPVTDGTSSGSEVCAEESSSNCEPSDQTLKTYSTAENRFIAKDEVDIEDNLSIKREPPLKSVDESVSNGGVSVLNNGFEMSTEKGDNDLGGVNKMNDNVKSGEFSEHDQFTPKHLLNPYASSDMEVRASVEDISTPLSTSHPNIENSSFHVIAAVDQLFGTKNVAVASKYVDILSTASERRNKSIVSSVVPCRSTPQSYVQDHRGANIISGISTLDFDEGQFIVNNVHDSMMSEEQTSGYWWLRGEKRNRMLLEARFAECPTSPSLKMETNNFLSTQERSHLSSRTIVEENDCLASQLPPSPSNSLIDVSSFHTTSTRPPSPPLMIMESNSSLSTEQPYSPSQVKVETNSTSTNQHVFTPQAIMEASSSATPKQPPLSVPSIYQNLRSSNKKDCKLEKGLNEKCLKCLPPTNLLKSILGKHSVQFHNFYSQYFCQCDNVKQPCSYGKMHSFILKLSKKDPKYLTAILTYLLYGQFEKPDVSSKFYSLCESSLNDESKNDNFIQQCKHKCMLSDPESVKMSSGVLRKNKNAGSFIKSKSVTRELCEDRNIDVSSTSATSTRASRRRGRKRKCCDGDSSHPTHEFLDVIPHLPAEFHMSFDDLSNKVKHVKSFKPSSTYKPRSFIVTPAMNDEFPKSPPFHGFYPTEVEIGKNFGNIWLESISPLVPFQGFEVPKRKRSENKSRVYDRWFTAKFLNLET